MSEALHRYREDGIAVFSTDAELAEWARACAALAPAILDDPRHAQWYRCAGTWFAGVNSLANDARGGLPPDLPALGGRAVEFLRRDLGFRTIAWDAAQISVAFPGYPRHGEEDTEASFRYRRTRYAAHVDGLERYGAERRRRLSETHSFLFGVPLGNAGDEQSPFVVWRGSHEVMRGAFREAFGATPPDDWREVDLTETYVAARRRCFETCEPVRIAPGLGGSYVMHPLALHGIAPWSAPKDAPPRAVAYFRPDLFDGDAGRWLTA